MYMKRNFKSFVIISIFLFAAGILASAQTYTWTGGYGNFKNPSHWSPNLPAGTTPAAFPAGTYKILSPGPCFLTENITFAGPAQIEVGSEINDGKFQLANYALRGTVTVTVNKKGTLELSGTDEHRNLFSGGKIILKTDSTVVYYGNTGKDIWQGAYQNLIVRGPVQAQSLTVNKTLKIERNPPAENPPIQITAPVQTYNGDVTVLTNTEFRAATSVTFGWSVTAVGRNLSFTGGGAVSMQGVTAGTVSAAGTSMLTVNGAVTLSGDLKAKNLTVNTATVSAAKIEVSQAAPVSTAATITAPTQTYTGKITAKNGSAYKNIIFITGSATGTGLKTKDLTAGNITVNGNWDAGDHDHPVNIEANGDIEVTGNFSSVQSTVEAKKVSGSGGNITVNTANTQWRCWGDITAEGNMIIKDMKASGGTIKILGNLTAGIFHFADYGKLLFSGSGTKTISFTTPSEIRELEIASGTTLNLLSDIKITHKLTNNGTFAAGNHSVTLTKANKIDTLDPDPIPSEIIITGTSAETSTQFKDLDCTDSYLKTLTINGKISVAGDLKLQGQSATSSLTVQGDTGNPHIALTSANSAKGQFLKVKTNIPIRGGTYTAEDSIPDGSDTDIQAGKPENWIFTNYNGAVSWSGKKSNAWADHRNWTPYVIPGKNTIVTIPVVTTQYPKLTANVKAKTITLAPGAKLDLADYVITDDSGDTGFAPLENFGTLKMTGTSGQTTWLGKTAADDKITHKPGSTVAYYGTTNNALWGGPYENLTVEENRKNIKVTSPSLRVDEKFTVQAASGDHSYVTIEAPRQTYIGDADIGANTTFTSSPEINFIQAVNATGKNLTFNGGGTVKTKKLSAGTVNAENASSLTVEGPVVLTGDLKTRKLNVNTATVTAAKIEVREATTVNTAATITATAAGPATQIYNGTVTLSADTEFKAKTSLLFAGTTSLSSSTSPKKAVELKSPVVEIRGDVDVNNVTITDIDTATKTKTITTGGTITAAGFYAQASEKIILKGAVKLGDKFVQTGNAAVQIGAPITDGARTGLPANGISFESKNLYLVVTPPATTTFDPSPSAVTKPDDCNIFVAGDLTLKNELKCANFVLFKGTVAFAPSSGGITTEVNGTKGDIVLFGPQYKANDTTADGASDPSETTGLFTYNHSSRTGSANANGYSAAASLTLPAALPDGTALPKETDTSPSFSGTFANLSGKTLKAGKNFYANGMNLSAPSWTLDIPNNDDATQAFAEAYFTTVSNCSVLGGGFVAAAERSPTDTITNSPAWGKDRLTIVEAHTYSDDTIYVRFNMDVENSKGEIARAINSGNIKFNNGMIPFKEALAVTVSGGQKIPGATLPNGDVHEFFLRTDGNPARRWNTDATGMYAGSNQSTDRGGAQPYASASGKDPVHQNTKPNLWIPKATSSIYAAVRDKYKNRIRHYAVGDADTSGDNGKIYGDVKDHSPPVLAAVYVGQETHVQAPNPVNQPKYDAHNFIEFRYSEPVFIDGISDNPDIATGAKYIRATDTIGNIETGSGGTITAVKGLAPFSSGKLVTGIRPGATSGSVHAVYRTAAMRVTTPLPPGSPSGRECRVRVSVAGWVEGTVSVPIGGSSTPVHNWVGYITQSETPSGSATPLDTANIRTRNTPPPLERWEKLDAQFVPKIYASSAVGLAEVSSWDTSPPVLAVVAKESAAWNTGTSEKEAVAYSPSSPLADRLEFHFFDNTPAALTPNNYWWKTTEGWMNGSSLVDDSRYDSRGGSRFAGSAATTGGIRACTIADSIAAFDFTHTKAEYNPVLQNFKTSGMYSQKAENEAFFYNTSSPHPDTDTLYLQLRIGTPAFPLTESFGIAYTERDSAHPNGGIITDLAGNKMKSFGNAVSSFDFPPEIALTVAPVGSNKMYILFSCPIDIEGESLRKIPANLVIDSGLEVDTGVPAVVRTDTKRATGLVVTLNRPVTGSDAIALQKRIEISTAHSPMAIKSRKHGYPAVADHVHKHVISDFAVNVVRPLFAYDEKMLDDGSVGFSSQNLYGDGSYAMRVFDGSRTSGNTVHEKEDITMKIAVENVDSAQIPSSLEMFIDNMPDPASVSAEFNELTGLTGRVWLPSAHPVLPTISAAGNTHAAALNPQSVDPGTYTFKLINNPSTPGNLNYAAGSRVGFLFPMADSGGNIIMMDNDGDAISPPKPAPTPPVPLYALRLKDPKDPASIDLSSFDIASVKRQAGGASILNNVINVNTGEQTLIKVDTERAGSLSVIVMTLDGDVLKILHSGRVEKGEHIYKWDGRNANGEPVARRLYFIRIVGPDIDETRKVMAVRE